MHNNVNKKFFKDNGFLILNKFYDLKTINSSFEEINSGQERVKKFFKKNEKNINH